MDDMTRKNFVKFKGKKCRLKYWSKDFWFIPEKIVSDGRVLGESSRGFMRLFMTSDAWIFCDPYDELEYELKKGGTL